ncbi:endonuclease domain-containing protein [Solirubrobacter taibaiensis]|nr:endonuclease domain-containing protein [Solirubrobacter taibaiensis]
MASSELREGEWLAAVYAAGEGAALTGFSGGRYWQISRFPERTIQVAVPKRRRAQAGFEIVPARLLLRAALALHRSGSGDHHDRARTQRDDRIQDAVLKANGFVVLRFREEHLDRPEEVLRQLAAQDLARRVAR